MDFSEIKEIENQLDDKIKAILDGMKAHDSWAIDRDGSIMRKFEAFIDQASASDSKLIFEIAGWIDSPLCISLISQLSDDMPEIFENLDNYDSEVIDVVIQRIMCVERHNMILAIINPKAVRSTYQGLKDYRERLEAQG